MYSASSALVPTCFMHLNVSTCSSYLLQVLLHDTIVHTTPKLSAPMHAAAAAAAAGQFATSPPGQGQVPGGFYWTGGYWGYCPPPTPPAPMAMAPPPPPGTTSALIKSPTPGFEVAAGPTGLAPVLLDASSSAPAPGRRIVSDCNAPYAAVSLSTLAWRCFCGGLLVDSDAS
jgi:hypothetical protein